MKSLWILVSLCPLLARAEEASPDAYAEAKQRHQESSRRLSDSQDELAADVQQLTIEQTDGEVIKLFNEVEEAMDEASERLWEHETGGETIAAQTEVIEKIYQAAKKRQQQKQSGDGSGQGSAMMDMLERQLGLKPGGQPQQNGEASQQGDGEGMTGDTDLANGETGGPMSGASARRRVPKGAGVAGKSLPAEFNDALKAYNRALLRLEP
ncbi:hypothetical protein [Haloferula sargassicola]|uniref:Uncharacterized protein n=1 Tax=Haloferula sargassicola TaxID=490096 RepID=A0ABP9URS7_9BACT